MRAQSTACEREYTRLRLCLRYEFQVGHKKSGEPFCAINYSVKAPTLRQRWVNSRVTPLCADCDCEGGQTFSATMVVSGFVSSRARVTRWPHASHLNQSRSAS